MGRPPKKLFFINSKNIHANGARNMFSFLQVKEKTKMYSAWYVERRNNKMIEKINGIPA